VSLLDIHQIKNYLPHRYPFLLVDRILEAEKEESLVAIKNVTYNEPFFEGHFPNRPVMPGVLIIEETEFIILQALIKHALKDLLNQATNWFLK